MLRLIFTIFALTITFSLPAQDNEKDYSEAIEIIEVWLEAQKDYEQLPGISASVIQGQEVIWSGGFGMANPEGNLPTTDQTIGSICSISKLFTAVAVMKLYEEGKLRLDDKVAELLPWYDLPQQYEESGPVTVRGLLTHSSGLPRESNHPYWTAPDFVFPTREEIISGLSEQETLYPSSTYYQYSNLGLTLLGEIVTQVSGQPYEQYVQENILIPLGLNQTRTTMPQDLYGQELAVGYSAIKRDGGRDKVQLFDAKGIGPAAGYSSTVLDLGKFAQWQFRLYDTTTTEILRPSTLKNMHLVHWTNPDWNTTWGLGFVVYKGSGGYKWVSHGGSCPGYRSTLQINPKKRRALAVIINASGTTPNKYSRGINAIINKVKKTKEGTSEEKDVTFDISDYKGYYNEQPWGSESYFTSWEGKLARINLPSSNPANSMSLFKHIEGDTFRRIRSDDSLGEHVYFYRDEEGTVFKYSQHGNYNYKMDR